MPKYDVGFNTEYLTHYYVEADSEEDAREVANNMLLEGMEPDSEEYGVHGCTGAYEMRPPCRG